METNTPDQKHDQNQWGWKRRGGMHFHKPDCKCRPCSGSRKRKAQAELGAAGAGGENLAPKAPKRKVKALVKAERHSEPVEIIHADGVFDKHQRSHRDRVSQWLLMRQKGMKNGEIAAQMGIQLQTLHTYLSKATKEGWLIFDDPAERLEHEIAPLVVENVKEFLGPTVEDRHRVKMTIETAKGLGLFQSHQAVKVEGGDSKTALVLNIEFTGDPTKVTKGGNIVGTPKVIDVTPEKVE